MNGEKNKMKNETKTYTEEELKLKVDCEIGNFIYHYTSEDGLRDFMMNVKEEYMGQCYE